MVCETAPVENVDSSLLHDVQLPSSAALYLPRGHFTHWPSLISLEVPLGHFTEKEAADLNICKFFQSYHN